MKTNIIKTQDYYSQTLIVKRIKLKLKILAAIKKCLTNYFTKPKYYDSSNKLVTGKTKDETAGVAIKEFVGLKPKMYSYLAEDNSEHIKTKGVNKNVVATISHY